MSDMADVLRGHELAIDYAEYFACTCGTIQDTTNGHHPEHVAAALSAAGFGPVQEARAEALSEFADFITRPKYEGLDAYTLEQVAMEARARSGGSVS